MRSWDWPSFSAAAPVEVIAMIVLVGLRCEF